jgi:hypothetical protein
MASANVNDSSFHSLTVAGYGQLKGDKGVKKGVDALKIPFFVVADAFRAPFHYAAQALKSAPVVPVVAEKPSWLTGQSIKRTISSSFKTLSKLQTIENSNPARKEYNDSVLKSVRDLKEFADKHKSTDTVAVIKGLKHEIKDQFEHQLVTIPGTSNINKSTWRTQWFGEYLNDPTNPNVRPQPLIAGFIREANRSLVGKDVMKKAIDELAEALAKDPLSDQAIPLFNKTLERLKKDGLLTAQEVKTALSGNAGKLLESSFGAACKRILRAAEPKDLSSVRNVLKSHSSALSASFGFKGVNVTGLFKTIQAEQKVAVKQVIAATDAQRSDLETQEADLKKRLDLDLRVDTVARKIGLIMTNINKLKACPNPKMAKLIASLKANATPAEVEKFLKEIKKIEAEAKAVLAKLKVNGKKCANVDQQIKSLEKDLKSAQLEQKAVIEERAQFYKTHKAVWFPAHDLKKVQDQLKKLEEGIPASQRRRGWLAPVLKTGVAAAAVAGAVFVASSYGYGPIVLASAAYNALPSASGVISLASKVRSWL